MTNYDAITDQFDPALSDLARRMYAGIVEGTSKLQAGNYFPAWEIALKENIRLGDDPSSEGDDAIHELFVAGLIEQAPRTEWSFRLTSAAWRAHLLAERAEREKPKAPEREVIDMGRCDNCGGALDNISTGIVVMVRGGDRKTVCGGCAHILAYHEYTIVAQAKSLLDDATEGRR